MAIMRAMLLAASQNRWLRDHASRYRFVKRSVSRFMPGENLQNAIAAARELKKSGATVQLATYEGGHGWRGGLYDRIREGVEWLDKNHAARARP